MSRSRSKWTDCVRIAEMSHEHPNCYVHTYIHVYLPISTPQDFFHTMEFSEKVERELDALQQSAVAYVGAGAREEGEVMGVVDSLRTNSREICEQVRTYGCTYIRTYSGGSL